MTGATRGRVAVAAALLAAAACGGSGPTALDSGPTSPTTAAAPTTVPTTTVSAAAPTSPAATATTAATTSTTVAPTTARGTAAPITTGASCVAELSVAERAALLVWPSAWANRWDDAVAAVAEVGVGGVLLMRPDGWSADEVAARLDDLEAQSRLGLVVAVDEEGGDVQRLDVVGTLPSQRDVSLSVGPSAARDLVADHGAAIAALGVDLVLGPVVDVAPPDGEAPLQGSRFFDGDPGRVTDYSRAYIEGWNDAGLVATLKHYPGHGSASADTHLAPGLTPPLDELLVSDLLPYRELAGVGDDTVVMVGHLTVPGLTDGRPATQSPEAIDLLRAELGHADALVVTDALGMAAVGLPEPEASVRALAAGIDVAVFTDTDQAGPVVDAIVAAVGAGTIPVDRLDAAAERVLRLLRRTSDGC